MRVIAMYLPQFHRTKENDAWWGEGFTEWTAVKKAEKLFEGHYQPRIPLEGNYYDLLQKKSMEEQGLLLKKYGIYGMCFYHYWFKEGRQTLEKPAENLLKWKDIDMPFCFSWANQAWTRTWSNFAEKNVWTTSGETAEEKKNNPTGILLDQKYGREEDWEKHFQYLLPFFRDPRYIKVNNRPVFMIYKPDLIACMPQMMEVWRNCAQRNGINEVYFIAMNAFAAEGYDAYLYHEPQYTISQYYDQRYMDVSKPVVRYIKYAELWDKIIEKDNDDLDKKVIYGGFVGYDDTPRRGLGGTVVGENSPEIFERNMAVLLKKNRERGNELTFINAWNEWGEGMYLEPDEKYGYKYLEALQNALKHFEDAEVPHREKKQRHLEGERIIKRYQGYWQVLHHWLSLKEKEIKLENVLLAMGAHRIAIYGIGMLGLHLVEELKNSRIEIAYGIDQRAFEIQMDFPVYKSAEQTETVDMIIVTAVHEFASIRASLSRQYEGKILSLAEIVEEADGYEVD